ncbi:4Fe-4S dicluster domain-containing protein [Chondromyces apiculatus]|nr:4Fe-4S dicluster domain-containing protein [Chondromyces apiculatus]
MKLLGAGLALAGIPGCNVSRVEGILPYIEEPREVTAGVPRFYATSLELDGFATGVLVQSVAGRPTKVDGNPDHPASLGASGVLEQASVLGLYDPSRARGMREGKEPTSWEAVVKRFGGARADRGAGLRFLLLPQSSPLVGDLVGRIVARHPEARFTFHAPALSDAPWEGAEMAFGRRLSPQRDVAAARAILSLDADFLAGMPFSLRYARQFAERRRTPSPASEMNRLYVVETALSPTGSMADHRFARRPGEVARFAAAVVAELGVLRAAEGAAGAAEEVAGGVAGSLAGGVAGSVPEGVRAVLMRLRAAEGAERGLAQAIARDLAAGPGEGLVIAGDRQRPEVHALAHLANALLGSRKAAWTTESPLIQARAAQQSLSDLVGDLRAGRVETLVVIEANPSYAGPPELGLSEAIRAARESIYLGHHENETAADCRWFVPMAHSLESWGDARAWDGTLSTVQPLLQPLFGGRTAGELLAVFAGEMYPEARRLLEDAARRRYQGEGFGRWWAEVLRRGTVAGSALPRVEAELDEVGLVEALTRLAVRFETVRAARAAPTASGDSADATVETVTDEVVEVAFTPCARVHDGRFANNAWLQELPDPVTKLTWDNAALISPAMARRLGVENEQVVELSLGGRSVRAPVLVSPGHADGAVTVHLGYGRRGAEVIAEGVGFDAYPLRQGEVAAAEGMVIRRVEGERHALAITQEHWSTHGRPIALSATLEAYRKEPAFTASQKGRLPTLLPEPRRAGEQWAMTIDTSICTGCSSCVVACQAENNVHVVGKEQVRKSREMHWLRIDTYYSGAVEAPEVVHQPMLCQHCEKAPCEYVCPTNATVHSPDGLNEMVYNRCVGTRFCSNNCPYKVRRFNFFDYPERGPLNDELVRLQRNPEVTVRERGVMEKCTYCVQRIRKTGIQARVEGRDIQPGEVVTACQQACPTGAIQFGSLSHTGEKVVTWREEPRSYAVLHELGTRPRTMYLARIHNPNPEIG